ncbi:MAG: hypothetical protein WCW26_02485, partial [Candidatus Buchananbacteria bacterium]
MNNPSHLLPKSYRKLGFGFAGLAVFIFVVILFLTSSKATIIINPGQEQISQDLAFTVKENATEQDLTQDMVNGRIISFELEGNNVISSTGKTKQEASGNVVGQVTIFNTAAKSQTLIATTRLAAPEDPKTVLVRLKSTVVIEPGKQATVDVYAENPAGFKEIKAMKFIIPGLALTLQEKIYAKNTEALSLGGKTVQAILEADL